MKISPLVSRLLVFSFAAVSAIAGINVKASEVLLFSDNFENGLSNWTGFNGNPSSAVVVADPLGSGSDVVSFTQKSYLGDLFTLSPISVVGAVSVKVRFDYLGKAVPGSLPGNFGGFVGLATTLNTGSGAWIAGTLQSAVNGAGFVGIHILDDGLWHSYEVDVTSVIQSNSWSSIYVKLQDWGDGGPVGDVFFDNVSVVATYPPRVELIKAVKPSFSNLTLGTNYQLQSSINLETWTNVGPSFLATNTNMIYPQYWDVDDWDSRFFRLQVTP